MNINSPEKKTRKSNQLPNNKQNIQINKNNINDRNEQNIEKNDDMEVKDDKKKQINLKMITINHNDINNKNVCMLECISLHSISYANYILL